MLHLVVPKPFPAGKPAFKMKRHSRRVGDRMQWQRTGQPASHRLKSKAILAFQNRRQLVKLSKGRAEYEAVPGGSCTNGVRIGDWSTGGGGDPRRTGFPGWGA